MHIDEPDIISNVIGNAVTRKKCLFNTNQNFVVNNDADTDVKQWLFADICQIHFCLEFAQQITLS